ncbi:MAG: alpha/beta hydrolase [Gammaproteobacteria bacterium]|nr:alpha/beta hydrolase [Gammaproteobacteria bacterium]
MTEFTLESARRLSESLPPIEFGTPSPDSEAVDRELLDRYLAHYSLDQLNTDWPVSHRLGSYNSLHYRLICQYFSVPDAHRKGVVVMVHGYYDHVGLFRHAIEYCLSLGYSVLTFDLPGHGLSSGDPAGIASFDHYSQGLVDCLEVARNNDIEGPWHVLAQSTGAAAVVNCLLNSSRFPLADLQKIVLLAPLLRPVDWRSGLWKFQVMRWFVKQTKRGFATNSHDEAFLQFILERDPLQARYLKVDWVRSLKIYLQRFESAASSDIPLHIVQGTEDTTVDWRYNLPRLTEKFPAARTHVIEGARHHLVNEAAEYRERIFAIVGEILGSG